MAPLRTNYWTHKIDFTEALYHLAMLNNLIWCTIQMSVWQVHLAIYSFANNQISSALQVLYRSRYLLLLSYGEQHPDVALVDVSMPCCYSCWCRLSTLCCNLWCKCLLLWRYCLCCMYVLDKHWSDPKWRWRVWAGLYLYKQCQRPLHNVSLYLNPCKLVPSAQSHNAWWNWSDQL